MSFNPGYIGTGAYAINASTLLQSSAAAAAKSSSSANFSATLAQASAPSTSSATVKQNRHEAMNSMQSLMQAHKAGANLLQASQSLIGNSYATAGDYLQALTQTVSQTASSGISTTA